MTSSTWTSDERATLLGVGIDAERVDRFERSRPTGNPLPLVFSDREVEHATVSSEPAAALCAAWCFKEALFKALGRPFDPREAEWLAGDQPGSGEVRLSGEIRLEFRAEEVSVRVLFPEPGECVTIVHVYREAG